ncbi:unnamed protein product [Gordionus sp. m RMFG-2023]|uniref:ATP-dependent RNA helicase DDX42-like n=1 Tax=Gordionus sp. m RMFG-2023 TaxID=3053472 RepID=UPI0030E05F38
MFKKNEDENIKKKGTGANFDPSSFYYSPNVLNQGVPPPKSYDTKYNSSADIPFDYLTGDNKLIKHRHRNEEEYFEADSDEEKANTKAMKRTHPDLKPESDYEELEYIPAPGSPTAFNMDANDDDDSIDPLEAFMSKIDKQAVKDLKEIQPSKRKDKGLREDIENEDEQESFFRYMEENPMAGVAYIEDDFQLEYDANGNPIVPERLKIIDPLPPIDHSFIKYKAFNKDFYEEAPDIAQLNDDQVKELKQKLGIQVTGVLPPKPVCSFAHFRFDQSIMSLLRKHEFTQPTPIQAQGIPIILSGRDLIGIAKTGSGKTLAYILPMIIHILDQEGLKAGQGPIALILVPTRELCIQVYQECKKFTPYLASRHSTVKNSIVIDENEIVDDFKIICAYGGGNMWEQQKALEIGCDILVATPGRLIDLIKKRAMSLEKVTYLVLDEADRMFDLGFEPQVRSITNHVRPDRQSLLFSATFKRKIEKLARDICIDPIKVIQGEHVGQANEDVLQQIKVFVENSGKWHFLKQNLVKYLSTGSVLIFVTKKINAEELASNLAKNDFKAGLLHGDLLQMERNRVILAFKKCEMRLLVATDVAARGLDIPHVRTVINYDIARDIDTHTHRVGRTGRAGLKGLAITFITKRDKEFAGHLVRNLEGASQIVPPELMELALQSAWFKKTRFGKNGKPTNNVKRIGGAGLGYKGTDMINIGSKHLSANFPSDHRTHVANTANNIGPGSERVNNIKAAFQAQYKNHFQASKQDIKWKSPATDNPFPNFIQAPKNSLSYNSNKASTPSTGEKRKKSRWE